VKRKAKANKSADSVATMIRMPQPIRADLEQMAARERRSVSKMAVLCIEEGLKQRKAA